MTYQTVINRILLITETFDKQYAPKETGIKKSRSVPYEFPNYCSMVSNNPGKINANGK